MRILVIDDESQIRSMISEMLADTPYEVVTAINGFEGVKVVHEHSDIEIIITDILMPEKEGIEVICEVKREFRHIKVLAISGGGVVDADSYLTVAKRLGADAVLPKPFTWEELLQALESLTGQKLATF